MEWRNLCIVSVVFSLYHLSQAQTCYEPGECTGGQVTDYIANVETYNDCLLLCQEDPDAECQWITYFSDKICLQYDGCPTVHQECTNCFSGEKRCPREVICNKNGACGGIALDYPTVQNVRECSSACFETPGCEWYSYLPGPNFCTLTEDCPEIDYDCNGEECVYGEKACFLEDTDSALIIVGGSYDAFDNYSGIAEVVSLKSSTSCIISDYPSRRAGLFGMMHDGQITFCGGFDGSERSKQCYIYYPEEDHWEVTTDMIHPRDGAAGVTLDDSSIWWITGGTNQGYETELKFANGLPKNYTNLPRHSSYHNLFKVNETHVAFVGFNWGSQTLHMYNILADEWQKLSNLPQTLEGLQSGLVTFPNGTQMLVTVGNYVGSNYGFGLDLDSMVWKAFPKLPRKVSYGASVQSRFTFYVVGGSFFSSDENERFDTIYKFDVFQGRWKTLLPRLSHPRQKVGAVMIPDDSIPCN